MDVQCSQTHKTPCSPAESAGGTLDHLKVLHGPEREDLLASRAQDPPQSSA